MTVHESLRTLVGRYGARVLDHGDDLRATLDDFLEEGEATPGDIALLVDAVRMGAYQQLISMLAHRADPPTAVEAAGARLANDRGGDQASASWACAALGYAVGEVPEHLVRFYRSQQPTVRPASPWDAPRPAPKAQPAGHVALTSRVDTPSPATVHVASPPPMPPPRPAPAHPPARSKPPVRAFAAVIILVALLTGGGTWLALADTGPETEEPETGTDVATTQPTERAGEDPLGVGAPLENQACEGQVLVVLASSGAPSTYVSDLTKKTDDVPGARYLRTDQSCDAFYPDLNGQPIYAMYIGPFDSTEEACEERDAAGIPGAYVRTLESGRRKPDVCSCQEDPDELPRVSVRSTGDGSSDLELRVADLQRLLGYADYDVGTTHIGVYDPPTQATVEDFQRDSGLRVDGWVGPQTWDALLRSGCP